MERWSGYTFPCKDQEKDKRLLDNNCSTLLLDSSENASLGSYLSPLRLGEEGS